jgi:pimeloyl-ACP methyl ester carboxylesterase
MWRLWFQEAIAMPGLGPSLLSRGSQPLARYLMMRHVAKPQSWSSSDLGAFLDPLRDPARARAGSATYRRLILPEALRMLRGAYREQRLATPTVVLYGAEDSTVRPAFFDGWEGHAARLSVEPVPGAAHFLADENPAFVTRRALEHFSHA